MGACGLGPRTACCRLCVPVCGGYRWPSPGGTSRGPLSAKGERPYRRFPGTVRGYGGVGGVHDGLAKPRPPVRHRERRRNNSRPRRRGAYERLAGVSARSAPAFFLISFPCLWKWTLPYFGRVCWRGGREQGGDIEERIARASMPAQYPDGVRRIDNSGPLVESTEAFYRMVARLIEEKTDFRQ